MNMPNRFPISARKHPGGFTLTEVLIVIGLIVLILAMAVPAFNFITGTRSIEAARNKVAAMIGRARSEAISRNAQVGVVFFRDPKVNAVGMQLVIVATSDLSGPEAYQAWSAFANYKTASGDQAADRVYALVYDAADGVAGGKYVVTRFDALVDNINVPPVYGGNTTWAQVVPGTASTLDGGIEYLPTGVGCQLVNDPKGAPANSTDKYVQTGMIVFDEQGKFIETSFTITPLSAAGQQLQLGGNLTGTSQLGLMLYDQEQLAGQSSYTPGDYVYFVPTLQPAPSAYAGAANEQGEEEWITTNALHLLVDRYTGDLIKVE